MPRGNDSEFLLQKKGADRVVQEEDLTSDEGNLKRSSEVKKADSYVSSDVEMEPYEGSLEIGQTDLDSFRAQDDLEESLVPVSPPQDDEDLYTISVSPVHTNSIQGSLSENEADYEIESPPKSPKRQKSVSFFLDNPSLSISAPQKSVQNEENNDDWAKRNQGTRGKVSDLILRFNEGNVKQSSSAYQSYKHEYGTARNIGRLQQTKFQ